MKRIVTLLLNASLLVFLLAGGILPVQAAQPAVRPRPGGHLRDRSFSCPW